MTYEMTLLESRMEGFQRGQAEGRTESTEKVAINMIRLGMDFSVIQTLTNLSIERIEELARKLTLKN